MKLLIHDYAGHPFQIGLSRCLAERGHAVTHVYYADNPGPKGMFERSDNPPSLHTIGVSFGHTVSQTALLARRFNDVKYGRHVAKLIREIQPDAVLSGNTPTEAQRQIIDACKGDTRFVYWVQDVYSIAVSKLVTKKLGPVGSAIGWYYRQLDRKQFRDSDSIVVITEDFVPLARQWARDRPVHVVENWAAISDIPLGERDNRWARSYGLGGEFRFVYSGTLGRKHNPELLLRLMDALPHAMMITVAQGVGVKVLEDRPSDQLRLLPLQPASMLPDVLATADVLVAMIEVDAGAFAVPSKVLSYLCAGRPILLAAPRENLAARTVIRAQAGIVVDPGDESGFLAAAERLYNDAAMRQRMGANGRAYAEKTFDLTTITTKFENILMGKP